MPDQASKAAVITGAAGGIGRALCSAFSKSGYRVLATDKTETDDIECERFVQADLNKICDSEESLKALASDIRGSLNDRRLTVLINNAAVQVLGSTESLTNKNWRLSLNVNVMAPFLLTQALLPELERALGSVINIGSVHAHATKPEFACYATTKAALVGMTRALAVDLGARVRVNAINPAAVATPMLLEGFEGNQESLDKLSQYHPVGRIAEPQEIAAAAIFLASKDAGFITGTEFNLDGAILSRLHDPE